MNIRRCLLALTLATIMALVLALTGCSSQTVEKYFDEHPEEWKQIDDQVKDLSGELFAYDLSAEGNQIKQVMTYTSTFDEEGVASMKEYFQKNEAALRNKVEPALALVEQQTEIKGVTWLMQYNNGDGTTIFSITIEAGAEPEQTASTEAEKPEADTSPAA